MGRIKLNKDWSIYDMLYLHFANHGNKGAIIYNSLSNEMMFYFRIDDGRK